MISAQPFIGAFYYTKNISDSNHIRESMPDTLAFLIYLERYLNPFYARSFSIHIILQRIISC